ncbi:helix-turn-helix domain-containing protein [Streptomyces sp. 4N509B]|uniref:helix-turn-helix domain-containing protein n=1 Tax=Streptomyces sp. 4N509B TaxID=3457413 RepID=UPI003FD4E3BF
MPRLVDPTAAAYYVGRPVGTLYRWASEGRIASHGGQYDIDQLRPATRDEWTREVLEAGPAPPLPQRAPRAA